MSDAYTVSKMLSSINAVMAGASQQKDIPIPQVTLKRKMDNGIMLDTSAKEIAHLDLKAKLRHSALQVATLSTRKEKEKYVQQHREAGNIAFQKKDFSKAIDCYLAALTGLDFGSTEKERLECQQLHQIPLTCNLTACMLMLKEWKKACEMSSTVLNIDCKHIKARQQRAKSYSSQNMFKEARGDLQFAIHSLQKSIQSSDTEDPTKGMIHQLYQQLRDISKEEQRYKKEIKAHNAFLRGMMRDGIGHMYNEKANISALKVTDHPTIHPAHSYSFISWLKNCGMIYVWSIQRALTHSWSIIKALWADMRKCQPMLMNNSKKCE